MNPDYRLMDQTKTVQNTKIFGQNKPGAVLFDFDGTLCFRTPSLNEVINRVIEPYFKLDPEKERISRRFWHYYWAPSAELIRDERIYGSTRDIPFMTQYAERYLKVLRIPPDLNSSLMPLVLAALQDTKSRETLGSDVTMTLEIVRAMGFKVGLLTNREFPIKPQLEEMEIAGYFDVVMTAGDAGMLKPSPLLFLHAAEKMGCDPEHVVYVGDNFYTDIAGAANAGLKVVLVDPQRIFDGLGCITISTVSELVPYISSASEER